MKSPGYITIAKKYRRLFDRAQIDTAEYVRALRDVCCGLPEIDAATAQQFVATVPKDAREKFGEEIEKILSPSFRLPKLYYGGPGPSEEERERDRLQCEAEMRAFAAALDDAFRAL